MRDDAQPSAVPRLAALSRAVAGLAGWRRLLAGLLAGMALTAGQAPVSLPWVWFAALPVIVWLVDGTARPREAAALGWAVAFGMFVSGLFWIGHAFMVDAEEFAWMMPFAVTLLPAGLGLFWAAAFWLARRAWPAGRLWRVILLAALLTLAEYVRSTALTGFPWGLAAYVWIGTPVAQAASVLGPHGLSFLTMIVTALPLVALAGARRGPGLAAAGGALALLAAVWAGGHARLAEAVPPGPERPVIRIVQPNAAQKLKWNPDYIPIFYARLLEATAAAPDAALGPPDAVVWPETAVTFRPAEEPEERARIAEIANGAPVILGALHRRARAEGGVDWSNALMTILPGGALGPRYDKHHLVPFGEYVPLRPILANLGIRQLAERGGFAPGPGPRSLALPGLPPFSPLICYEAIFPDEVVPAGPRPGWLLQVTNDGWFGGFGGPQQHFAQARFRAIEQGLPLVRAANTGISAMIDPLGRVVRALPLGAEGRIDARLPAPIAAPLYARTGDWPALAAALLVLFVSLRAGRRRG